MRTLTLGSILVSLFAGCGSGIEGPAPLASAPAGVEPGVVCAERATWVAVRGSGLSPLPTELLTGDPRLVLPRVELIQAQDLAGAPVAGAVVAIPDDPADAAASHVRWLAPTELQFEVIPELALAPGRHTVRVTNGNGQAGEWPAALLAVPRPRTLAVTPDVLCGAADLDVVLTGAAYLRVGDAVPLVSLTPLEGGGSLGLTPTALGRCQPLPGAAEAELCEELSLRLSAGTLGPGAYALVVTNPAPAGCSSTEPVTVTAVAPPVVADAAPDVLCTAAGARDVVVTGSGFLTVAGVGPTVTLGGASLAATPGDCVPVSGAAATVQSCTTLAVTVPATAAPGLAPLVVANPAPAACTAEAVYVYVAPAPQLESASPSDVCTALPSTVITVAGTGLLTIDAVAPSLAVGGTSVAATAEGCEAVTGLKEAVAVCTTLRAAVPQSALAAGSVPVTATNPPPAGCATAPGPTLEAAPPPAVTAVSPSRLCAAGGTVTVTGAGFRPGATVSLGTQPAASVGVTGPGQLTATFGAIGLATGVAYPLTVANADGCSATFAAAVTVVPGPQLFFADPPVVYNGISTRVTLYGAAITGSVSSLAIRPSGTADAPTVLSYTVDALNPNRIQVLLPAGTAPGRYDVILGDETACPATLTGGLQVVAAVTLALTEMTPTFGAADGPTAVTVRADPTVGGGFQPVPRLYLNPQTGSQAAALGAVAWVDPARLTALVPAGLPVDTYDLIAVNPDGAVGLLADAFTVTTLPPPVITGVTPGSIPNQSGQTVKVTGADFRAPAARLRCLDLGTNTEVERTPAFAAPPSATELILTVDASSFSMGALCVVRITNGDDRSYADYSSLVITNLAQNLTAFRAGPTMTTARRALAAAANEATPAARFVYAIGGDDGTTAGALASVEAAPVDIYGEPGAFAPLGYGLVTPRSFAGAAAIGRCLYLAGGVKGSTVLATIERGCVLDPATRPTVTDVDLQVVAAGGLGAGLWYYQVAAVRPASDPTNPGGETLPSEPFPVLLPALADKVIAVTPRWTPVAGAVGYRVYRSPAAGAAAGALQLLAEVGPGVTSYTDAGGAVQAARPLALGATGRWHVVATLATARQGAGVAAAPDPGDATGRTWWLYVVGGKDAANHALASYERLGVTVAPDGSQAVSGLGAATATLGTGRWQLGLYSVGNENAALVSPPTRYLYAGGGLAAGGSLVGAVDALPILAGGALGAPVSVDPMQPFRAGYGLAAANDFLFAFGGTQGNPNDTASSILICAAASGSFCPSGPPALENWNNVSGHLTVARVLMGSAVQSGFIYLLGGATDTAAATSSTELTIW
jgi:hypothetical protein